MKTIKIIISLALANILLVIGLSLILSPKNNDPIVPSDNSPCIVTVSGVRYDVQQLRNTHSGGDIFVCNTDMTKTFFDEHGESILNDEMQKYRLP